MRGRFGMLVCDERGKKGAYPYAREKPIGCFLLFVYGCLAPECRNIVYDAWQRGDMGAIRFTKLQNMIMILYLKMEERGCVDFHAAVTYVVELLTLKKEESDWEEKSFLLVLEGFTMLAGSGSGEERFIRYVKEGGGCE